MKQQQSLSLGMTATVYKILELLSNKSGPEVQKAVIQTRVSSSVPANKIAN